MIASRRLTTVVSRRHRRTEVARVGLLDRLRSKAASATPGSTGLPHQIAFVDVETTGLDPRVHRVIEVGIVITDARGNVIDEWCSLVRPDGGEVSAGADKIHLIEAAWLRAAPTFAELLPQIAHRLNGRVIAAHNAQFDVEFLQEEFKRAGFGDAQQGNWVTLCTVALARAVDVSRKLDRACFDLGIRYEKHSALGDARACAQLLHRFMAIVDPRTFAGAGVTQFGYLPELVMVSPVLRDQARTATTARPVLEPLIASLPPHDATADRDPGAAEAYLVALQDAIADGYLSADEVAALSQLAVRNGLTREEVRDLHQELVLGLIDTALSDRRITAAERSQIEQVSKWLNVDVADWDAMVRAARNRIKAAVEEFRSELRGKSVAFTGAGIYKPSIREALAAKHGFSYGTRVGDGVDLLVVGTERTETQQVERARERGVPLMVEPTFWRRLGEV